MKKIFLSIIFLILLTASIRGQVINDPTTYDSVTVLYGDDYFGIDRNLSESRTVSWGRMVTQMQIELALDLLTSNNTWSGSNSFTNSITLPGSLSPTLTNGIGFNSGLFSWSNGNGDTLFTAADRGWVIDYVTTNGYEGDLSAYATKAGNNSFTGTNTMSSLTIPYGGTFKINGQPSRPAYGCLASKIDPLNSGKVVYVVGASSSAEEIFATREWTEANYGLSGAYIKATGTQTGITSTLTWSSGTVTPYILDPVTLKIPNKTPTTTDEITYDDGQGETGLYVKASSSTLYMPDEDVVQDMIDNSYSYNAPTASSASADTLNFSTDRNFIDKIYTIPSGGITLRFTSGYGFVKVIMKGTQEDVTFDAGTSTIKWVGGEVPSIAWATPTNKYWVLVFERISSTEIMGSWIWMQ